MKNKVCLISLLALMLGNASFSLAEGLDSAYQVNAPAAAPAPEAWGVAKNPEYLEQNDIPTANPNDPYGVIATEAMNAKARKQPTRIS